MKNLYGKRVLKTMDIWLCIPESLCCTLETNNDNKKIDKEKKMKPLAFSLSEASFSSEMNIAILFLCGSKWFLWCLPCQHSVIMGIHFHAQCPLIYTTTLDFSCYYPQYNVLCSHLWIRTSVISKMAFSQTVKVFVERYQ